MKINYAALLGFAAVISVLTPEIGNSESSILTFLPAILAKNKSNETFRLSPLGTQYTGSEKLSFLSIDFPDFAVERADVVEVTSYSDYKKVVGDVDVVKAFSMTPVGQNIFRKPVSVTVTLDAMPEDSMPFYADDDGQLWPMTIKERNGQSVTFSTQHASDFLIARLTTGVDVAFDTGFDPAEDGFQINNTGDNLFGTIDGNCAGMSFFSVYHFVKNKSRYGGLYNNFKKEINGVPGWIEQHLIAGYMQNSYNEWLIRECNTAEGFTCIESSNIEAAARYMKSTGQPIVIGVSGWRTEQNTCIKTGHALVASGYDLAHNTLTVYDPNHKGVEYEWVVGTVLPVWAAPDNGGFAWEGVDPDFWMFGGSMQEQIAEMTYKVYQANGPDSDIMDIATSKIKVTTPGDGWIDHENNGHSFYIRGSIDKGQIFPPERLTFNIYNGKPQFTCLARWYDQWDLSYIYSENPDESVTVDVDPVTGSFEAIVDFTFLNRMEKLEALSYVTVGGEEIELKTNLWKADGTAMSFDTYTMEPLETNIEQCFDTWCPGFPHGRTTCFR
ncbi:hypothetical protein H206_00269 [Candidatus Electrothrix aarhusensis]|uniref:Uncharacterized protein n=1 Tax=Candidatus Electrothrix aarhusensis TaxID=1859131 RepID=A0A444J1H3_9BACT|nr:hypothetical protein H206_00269 [Candidatus Electrothrix aarhusensis]